MEMDNVKIESVVQQPAPKTGEPLKMETTYTCDGCEVEAVLCNGRPVVKESDRNPASGYYKVSEDKISLIIEEFASSMQGIYQAIFIVGTANVTKTIMEIEGKLPTPPPPSPSSSSNETDTPAVPTDPSKADNDTTTQTTTTKKDEESPVTVIKETRNVKKDSVVKEEIPFNCTDCEVEKVMFGNESLENDTSKAVHYTVEDKIIKVSIEKFNTSNAGDYSATFTFKEGKHEPHTEVILSLSLESPVTVIKETRNVKKDSVVKEEIPFNCTDCEVEKVMFGNETLENDTSKPEHYTVEDKIIKVSIEKFDTLNAGDYSATFKFKEREPHTEVILSLSLESPVTVIKQTRNVKKDSVVKEEIPFNCTDCEVEKVMFGNESLENDTSKAVHYTVEDKIIKVSIEKFNTSNAGDYSATFTFKEGKHEPHTEVILSLSLESPVTVIKQTRNVKKDSVVKEEIPFNCTDCEVEKVMFGNESLENDTSKPEHYTVEDKIIKVSIEKFDTLNAGDYSATFKFKEREPHTEVILSLSLE
ncbi:uncharacterized protein LOC105383085 isoform X2 [Plutella xylostella]|uniref:uncharacterized protein LOC105383085 isoform X2 n=1 Tax=Plutella xylostella TaxID=51655 RepID=UPI002032B699|nr:uncharacterized protein LOC105383085 isoform X2 [Plutella xylostella]